MPAHSTTPQEAFLTAYDEYADELFRFCYYRTFDRENARDLMQDTFTKTWEYIASGKHVDNLRAFLYKTARHGIVDEVRKRKVRKQESFEGMIEEGIDFAGENGEDFSRLLTDKQKVATAVKAIKEPYRTVVLLRYLDGLSLNEISSRLGESTNTITVRVHRGIQQLRSRLSHDG